MKPTKGKVLLKFVSKKSDIILLKQETKLIGEFYIQDLGKECDPDLKIGQKVTMRDHYYYVKIEATKEDTDKGIYFCIIDQSEIWGIQDV